LFANGISSHEDKKGQNKNAKYFYSKMQFKYFHIFLLYAENMTPKEGYLFYTTLVVLLCGTTQS